MKLKTTGAIIKMPRYHSHGVKADRSNVDDSLLLNPDLPKYCPNCKNSKLVNRKGYPYCKKCDNDFLFD